MVVGDTVARGPTPAAHRRQGRPDARRWTGGGVAFLALLGVVAAVAHWSPPPDGRATDVTATLGLITAAAIGIERVVEAFWSIIGLTKGSGWPLGDEFERRLTRLDQAMQPLYAGAMQQVNRLEEAGVWGRARADEAKRDIQALEDALNQLRVAAPLDPIVGGQRLTEIGLQQVEQLKHAYPTLDTTALAGQRALGALRDLVATFQENPGRRLISIYLGALLGLLVAGLFGLDVLAASSASPGDGGNLFPRATVALTGLLMGLGASPTHEVIRAIQEYKNSRKAGTPG